MQFSGLTLYSHFVPDSNDVYSAIRFEQLIFNEQSSLSMGDSLFALFTGQ